MWQVNSPSSNGSNNFKQLSKQANIDERVMCVLSQAIKSGKIDQNLEKPKNLSLLKSVFDEIDLFDKSSKDRKDIDIINKASCLSTVELKLILYYILSKQLENCHLYLPIVHPLEKDSEHCDILNEVKKELYQQNINFYYFHSKYPTPLNDRNAYTIKELIDKIKKPNSDSPERKLIELSEISSLDHEGLKNVLYYLKENKYQDCHLSLPNGLDEECLEALKIGKDIITGLTLRKTKSKNLNKQGEHKLVLNHHTIFNQISKLNLKFLDISQYLIKVTPLELNELIAFLSLNCKNLTEINICSNTVHLGGLLEKLSVPEFAVSRNQIIQEIIEQINLELANTLVKLPCYFRVKDVSSFSSKNIIKLSLQSLIEPTLKKFDFQLNGKNLRLSRYIDIIEEKPELKEGLPFANIELVGSIKENDMIFANYPSNSIWFLRPSNSQPNGFVVCIKATSNISGNHYNLIHSRELSKEPLICQLWAEELKHRKITERSLTDKIKTEISLECLIKLYGLSRESLVVITEIS